MVRVHVTVQETDSECLDLLFHEQGYEGGQRRFIECPQYRTVGGDPLGHDMAADPRHERLRPFHINVVLLEPVLIGNFDGVAKAVGGDERGPRSLTLDQRVGRERRAVNDQPHLAG